MTHVRGTVRVLPLAAFFVGALDAPVVDEEIEDFEERDERGAQKQTHQPSHLT